MLERMQLMANRYTLDPRLPRTAAIVLAQPLVPKAPAKVLQPTLKSFACPRCSGPLVRVHRHLVDIAIGLLTFLPVRRYRCRRNACSWGGVLEHPSSRRSSYNIDARYRSRLQRP